VEALEVLEPGAEAADGKPDAADSADGTPGDADSADGKPGVADNADGESGAKKGDPTKALQAERARRRQLMEENRQLRTRLESLIPAGPAKDGAEKIADEDLVDAATMRKMFAQRDEAIARRETVRGQVDSTLRLVDEFTIFADEEVGTLARDALEARLVRTEPEKWAKAVEETAKAASAMKVSKDVEKGQGTETGKRHPPAPGAGASEAAHLDLSKPPKSLEEASRRARGMAAGLAKTAMAKLGIG